MEKVWLKQYPVGVAVEIDCTQYASLVALLDVAFSKYATRSAITCMGKSLTFAQLDMYSRHIAAWLQAQGLQPGARVALMMPNILPYPLWIAAILRAGYVVVNINPLYTARELEHQLIDSGAEVIVVLENFAAVFQKVVARTQVKHIVVLSMGDMLGKAKGALVNFVVRKVKKMVPSWSLPGALTLAQVLRLGGGGVFKKAKLTHSDIAFLQYTGGTTGVAKGAALTHRNLIANVLQLETWMQPALRKQLAIAQIVSIGVLPLYHIFGLTVSCLLSFHLGGLSVLIPNPRDIPGLIKVLASRSFHMSPAVNTLYGALINHPDARKIDFSNLKVSVAGGMAVQEVVAKKWLSLTGCPIIEGYGLSETSPVATCNLDEGGFTGTIGLPMPSTEVVIRGVDGADLPYGEIGEICIRGPQVMQGYWQQPAETAAVMTQDGYFKSGDMGVMDSRGYIKLAERKKDIIIVSGFNVYPSEVENIVASHPGVLEVAAVGTPDAHSGEVVKIFVVRKDANLSEADLIAYCRENLTAYKCPKQVVFCDQLPKSTVGKILRRVLRNPEELAQAVAAAS